MKSSRRLQREDTLSEVIYDSDGKAVQIVSAFYFLFNDLLVRAIPRKKNYFKSRKGLEFMERLANIPADERSRGRFTCLQFQADAAQRHTSY